MLDRMAVGRKGKGVIKDYRKVWGIDIWKTGETTHWNKKERIKSWFEEWGEDEFNRQEMESTGFKATELRVSCRQQWTVGWTWEEIGDGEGELGWYIHRVLSKGECTERGQGKGDSRGPRQKRRPKSERDRWGMNRGRRERGRREKVRREEKKEKDFCCQLIEKQTGSVQLFATHGQ